MTRLTCGHREYDRGYCGEMSCDNYASKHGWPWPAPDETDEPDYGGAFDGFQVTSDADPGL